MSKMELFSEKQNIKATVIERDPVRWVLRHSIANVVQALSQTDVIEKSYFLLRISCDLRQAT